MELQLDNYTVKGYHSPEKRVFVIHNIVTTFPLLNLGSPSAFLQQTLKVSTHSFLLSSFSAVIRYDLLLECPTSNVCSGNFSGEPASFSSTPEKLKSKPWMALLIF